jgi:tetrapyrrole methylase family protein/MazG family protein
MILVAAYRPCVGDVAEGVRMQGMPETENARGRAILRVLDVVATLRGKEGCPWDRKQTLESLRPYLLEECAELLDAIENGDVAAHRDELGDVLLQVLLQSRIREEKEDFDFEDVAEHLAQKLIRRHPHVFGDAEANTPDEVVKHWERIKQQERGKQSTRLTLDGIPLQLPALHRAQRMQDRAGRKGFDWDCVDDVVAKVQEELNEVCEAMAMGDADAVEAELGDLLFAAVNLCRFHTVDAEGALRRATNKFATRFHAVERRLRESGRRFEDCSLSEMDQEWERVKAEES